MRVTALYDADKEPNKKSRWGTMTKGVGDSAFARRAQIHKYIVGGIVDASVIEQLVYDGKAVNDEATMWDFKASLPVTSSAKVNEYTKKQHDAKLAEIVKDCVSFYNSYGGYIIAGIDDRSRELIGFSGNVDAADLNKRIQGATGASIETIYRVAETDSGGKRISLGILFIPQRPEDAQPTQFKKSAPENEAGRRAYNANDFYMRERDNCRPAVSVEDLEFIFSRRKPQDEAYRLLSLDHNLPPRDFDLVNLIGREDEIALLWKWLSDTFNPIKILCGVGGVGKTSIAYTFSERLIYQSPGYITKLVWLGAKEMGYGPLSGRLFKLPRVDFSDIDKLLIELLLQTGCPFEQIPDAPSRDQLLHLTQSHLSEYPYLLVIDNVDSLDDEEQQQIFHLFTQLCSISRAKAIITARRNLGASRSVYIEVEGLEYEDFEKFVEEKCKFLRLPMIPRNSASMRSLYDASGGSPLFALSVLRLVILGDTFADAIRNWKGCDGEVVRRAAFEREIGRLNAFEAKTLLVLCYLGQASSTEVARLADMTRYDVQNALETLQSFSMTLIDQSLPSGVIFKVPQTLSLISSLVEKRVPDWKAVRDKCDRYIALRNNQEPFVADTITKTMAHLRTGDHPEALVVSATAIGVLPDNQDLYCLMGRVYLAMDDSRAEETYKKAYDLGCRKRELLDGWIEHRERRSDWKGVLDIAVIGEREHNAVRYCIARYNAEMMIADQLAKVGKYPEADSRYELSIAALLRALGKYKSLSEQRLIKELNNTLTIRWLGVVRMVASQQSNWQPRYLGACRKAIVNYKNSNENVLRYSIAALSEWLDKVGSRDQISETAYGQLCQVKERLIDMLQNISVRDDISTLVKERFASDARRPMEKLDLFIAQYEGVQR